MKSFIIAILLFIAVSVYAYGFDKVMEKMLGDYLICTILGTVGIILYYIVKRIENKR